MWSVLPGSAGAAPGRLGVHVLRQLPRGEPCPGAGVTPASRGALPCETVPLDAPHPRAQRANACAARCRASSRRRPSMKAAGRRTSTAELCAARRRSGHMLSARRRQWRRLCWPTWAACSACCRWDMGGGFRRPGCGRMPEPARLPSCAYTHPTHPTPFPHPPTHPHPSPPPSACSAKRWHCRLGWVLTPPLHPAWSASGWPTCHIRAC